MRRLIIAAVSLAAIVAGGVLLIGSRNWQTLLLCWPAWLASWPLIAAGLVGECYALSH